MVITGLRETKARVGYLSQHGAINMAPGLLGRDQIRQKAALVGLYGLLTSEFAEVSTACLPVLLIVRIVCSVRHSQVACLQVCLPPSWVFASLVLRPNLAP